MDSPFVFTDPFTVFVPTAILAVASESSGSGSMEAEDVRRFVFGELLLPTACAAIMVLALYPKANSVSVSLEKGTAAARGHT